MEKVRWKKKRDRIETIVEGIYFGVKDESEIEIEAIVSEVRYESIKRAGTKTEVISPSVSKWEEQEIMMDVPTEVIEADIIDKVLGIELARKHVIFQAVPSKDLSNVKAYPNPFRRRGEGSSVKGEMKFINLTATSSIRIYNLNTELVREIGRERLQTLYGSDAYGIVWDGRNDDGDEVSSGIYFYLITDDNNNKAKGKILVIR